MPDPNQWYIITVSYMFAFLELLFWDLMPIVQLQVQAVYPRKKERRRKIKNKKKEKYRKLST